MQFPSGYERRAPGAPMARPVPVADPAPLRALRSLRDRIEETLKETAADAALTDPADGEDALASLRDCALRLDALLADAEHAIREATR